LNVNFSYILSESGLGRLNGAVTPDGARMGSIVFHTIAFERNSSWSLGSEYVLRFSSDGNLELWNESANELIWESGTRGEQLIMQGDGNLVIYTAEGEPVWASNTSGHEDAVLVLEDNGAMAILSSDGKDTLWEVTP